MPQTQQPAPTNKPQGFVNILCSEGSIKSLKNKILKEGFLYSLQAYQTKPTQIMLFNNTILVVPSYCSSKKLFNKTSAHRSQIIPNSPTNPIALQHKILETITPNLLQPQLTIKQFSNTRTIPGASINASTTFKPTQTNWLPLPHIVELLTLIPGVPTIQVNEETRANWFPLIYHISFPALIIYTQ